MFTAQVIWKKWRKVVYEILDELNMLNRKKQTKDEHNLHILWKKVENCIYILNKEKWKKLHIYRSYIHTYIYMNVYTCAHTYINLHIPWKKVEQRKMEEKLYILYNIFVVYYMTYIQHICVHTYT